MRPRIVATIFRKEIRETLRDKRTLRAMIFLPILLYPMMILGISWLTNSQEEQTAARASQVAVWGDAPPQLVGTLRASHIEIRTDVPIPPVIIGDLKAGRIAPVKPLTDEEEEKQKKEQKKEADTPLTVAARPVLLDRKIDALLVLWPNFSAEMTQGDLGHAVVLYDSTRPASEKARSRVDDALHKFRDAEMAMRERQHNLPAGFSQTVEIGSANVAPPSRRAGFGMGMMLPFLLITMCLTPLFYAAVDSTAGEKERNTMQTLLCAPLRPLEIIGGKFLAIAAVGILTAAINVISLSLTVARVAHDSMGGGSVALHQYVLSFLMLIPIVLLTAGVFLTVAVFARDFKEGQSYLMPALWIIMLPCIITVVPTIELNAAMSFVPLANIALLIKAILMSEAAPDLVFLTLASSLMYTALAVAAAARVFSRESVLVGGGDTVRGFLGMDGPRTARPGGAAAILVFCTAMVAAFYGSLALEGRGVLVTIVVVEAVFLLAPALVALRLGRFSAKETLLLRMPDWRGLLAGLLVGVCGGAVAAGIGLRLIPVPADFARALEKALLIGDAHVPLIVLLLAIAVLPGICEELLFRGFILSGLRGAGIWAIPLTALLFGLAHSSIYRILPTFLIGLFITILAWRTRSIVPGMIAHAVNNGLILTLVRLRPSWFGATEMRNVPWSWMAVAALGLAVAFALLGRQKRLSPEQDPRFATAEAA